MLLEVLQDEDIQKAFSAQNTVDVLIELVKDKFTAKGWDKINEYVSLMEVMSGNQAFQKLSSERHLSSLLRQQPNQIGLVTTK